MQQMLLLTLQGPRHKLDIEVPGDVPVSDLLPILRQMCGDPADAGTWLVSRLATGKPLQITNTLVENRVLDGEFLVLHKEGVPVGPQKIRRQEGTARTQGGSIIITWEK